jgi:transcriptional repressor NrdR
MKCPFCRRTKTEVYNSRTTRSGGQIWRRRRCLACLETFTTYEAADLGFLRVVDANGKTSPYQRSQLYAEVAGVLQERPETVAAITDTIESKLLDLQTPAISARDISDVTLTTLKHFNTPAFLRYLASHGDVRSARQAGRQLRSY